MSLSRTQLHNDLKQKIKEKGLYKNKPPSKVNLNTKVWIEGQSITNESEEFIHLETDLSKVKHNTVNSTNESHKSKKYNKKDFKKGGKIKNSNEDSNEIKNDKNPPKYQSINEDKKYKNQNNYINNSNNSKKRKVTQDIPIKNHKKRRLEDNPETIDMNDSNDENNNYLVEKVNRNDRDEHNDYENEEDASNRDEEKIHWRAPKFKEHKKSLPIFQTRNAFKDIAKQHDVVILVGETGSGKTTQVPQFLAEWNEDNRVVVTQPRRVAAVSVSKRVSEEFGAQLGEEVGYKVRFEEKYNKKKTRILFVTDGMLLREAQLDPLLREWDWVILDEAHERTLHTDILFGIVKRALLLRKKSTEDGEQFSPLKVIVMSATLEAASFSNFFFNAPILYVTGRQYPVEVYFTSAPQKDYLDSIVRCVLQVHTEEELDGDILAFLTGQDEILAIQSVLEEKAKFLPVTAGKLIVYPLFAALPHKQQMETFKPPPPGCRKVILSTNIAETSITIPGIKYVIDSGVVKSKTFFPDRGLEDLHIYPISKASARQRCGRAGRERAGKCYRLYTEEQYEEMEEFTIPEIKRSNLSTVVLQMKSMGINDILSFDFLDPPPKDTLENSLAFLQLLGALDMKHNITNLGKQMSKFPLDPMYSLTLLRSIQNGCVQEILSILSMLSVESIFYSPSTQREESNIAKKRFTSQYGDHLTYLYVYKSYIENKGSKKFCENNFINQKNMKKVIDIRKQLTSYMKQLNYDVDISCGKDIVSVRKCLLSAGFLNIAMRKPQTREYKTLHHNVDTKIHPSSTLQNIPTSKLPDFVLFNILSKTNEFYIRDLTVMERDWLLESQFTNYFRGRIPKTVQDFDKKKSEKGGNTSNRFKTIVSA